MSDNRLFALESSAIDIILARASALKLTDPGPSPEDLTTILSAGARAPDHGRLRPWRFLVVQKSARERLGGLLAEYFFGFWWADYLATSVILAFVAREAIESYHELHEE